MKKEDLAGIELTAERVDNIRLLSIAFILLVFILISAHTFIDSLDDLALRLSPNYEAQYRSLLYGSDSNYRYLVMVPLWALYRMGFVYFNDTPVWAMFFTLSMFFCTAQISRYIGLSRALIPWIFLCIAVHSFWIDSYRFSLGYITFGMAFFFSGLSIATLANKNISTATRVALATLFAYLSAISYQSSIWLLIYAPALAALYDAAHSERSSLRVDIRRFLEAMTAFFIACALTLATIKIAKYLGAGPDNRSWGGIQAILNNLHHYPSAIIDLFHLRPRHTPYNLVVPFHERVLFGASIIGAFAIAWKGIKAPRHRMLILMATLGSVAISINPINILMDVWWASLRSMTATSFWFVLLFFVVGQRWLKPGTFQTLVLSLALFSLANHVSLMLFKFHQAKQDEFVALQMINDIRKETPITPDTKIAITSTWHTPFQLKDQLMLDIGGSAFSAPWSRARILQKVAGVHFKDVKVSNSVCTNYKQPWEIRKIDDIFVVCTD